MKRRKIKVQGDLQPAHVVDAYLRQPTNPVTLNLIGAGGTGSHVLACLGSLHYALLQLGHPGLHVTVFDDALVRPANIGRQAFSETEIGAYKASAIVSRANRFWGTNWKAVFHRWQSPEQVESLTKMAHANITISCVDTAPARFAIAEILRATKAIAHGPKKRLYWIDFGNGRDHGQVLLSTVTPIGQPESKNFLPRDVLPFATDEWKSQLESADEDNTPSCSVAQSLEQQSLFINRSLAQPGGRLLENLFRMPVIGTRGFFFNMADFYCRPIRV